MNIGRIAYQSIDKGASYKKKLFRIYYACFCNGKQTRYI